MRINPDEPSASIMDKLAKYMELRGLVFRNVNLDDSSPYALLYSSTSIGYTKQARKFKHDGIYIMCSKDGEDLSRLVELGLEAEDNSTDATRPNAVHVPDEMLDLVMILVTSRQQFLNYPDKTDNWHFTGRNS